MQLTEGHGYDLYNQYIQKGKGDLQQIAVKASELEWLFANTVVRAETGEVSERCMATHEVGVADCANNAVVSGGEQVLTSKYVLYG